MQQSNKRLSNKAPTTFTMMNMHAPSSVLHLHCKTTAMRNALMSGSFALVTACRFDVCLCTGVA